MRRAQRSRIALLVVVPLVLLFAGGEIAGRLLERYAGYMPRRGATYLSANPYLRSALMPGADYRSGNIRIEVNTLGFRGDEFAPQKPDGTFRIFAVGESSTFGWKGVEDHRGAWPYRLERLLNDAQRGHTVEVINAGVPGYTSVEQRVNFMLRISHFEPDALLIYHGNNDIDWSWVPDLETNLIYRREVIAPVNEAWNALINHSYVYLELRKRLMLLELSAETKYDDPDPAALAMLKENLRGLAADARRQGARVAIATFAHALDERGEAGVFSADEQALGIAGASQWFQHLSVQGARRSFPLYNQNVRDLAREEDLLLVDLAPLIPQTPEYHTDWCHLTAKGHEAVAATFANAIVGAGWLEAH